MKKLLSVMALLVISLLAVPVAFAATGDLTLAEVEVNNVEVNFYETLADIDSVTGLIVEEGEVLDIDLLLEASSAEDVEVSVAFRGFEYGDYIDLEDRTHLFDIEGSPTGATNQRSVRGLQIELPTELDDDRYFLRVTVEDKDSATQVFYVVLEVEPSRHRIDIDDVLFSPGTTIQAGRSLLVTVDVENNGDRDEDDVRARVSIPALGVQDVMYLDDEIDAGDDVTFDQLFLPIPVAAAGVYEVVVEVDYDNFETVRETYTINVVADERVANEGTLVLAVGPESQSMNAGQTASYAIALTNAGRFSTAYMLTASAGDWGQTSVSDNLVVLEPGQNEVVYVQVTPSSSAAVGNYMANVAISSGNGEALQTVGLGVNVLGESQNTNGLDLKSGIEIALIILVVLLVIIGLIIGFSRLRRDDEEEQTYY